MTRETILRVIIALMLWVPLSASANTVLPDTELAWENIRVDGRKIAVYSIFRDSRGLIWLGTNSGLYFYDGVATHPVKEAGLFGTQIFSFVEKDGRLYIGSNNGLIIYEYSNGVIIHSDTPVREIRALLDGGKGLWIGGLNGLVYLDLKSNAVTDFTKELAHASVYCLMRDSRGDLYVGSYSGVAKWNGKRKSFSPLKITVGGKEITNFFANSMLESSDKRSIHIGGAGSLLRFYPSSGRWEMVEALRGYNVKSLANGRDGSLFIGTDNGLLELRGDTLFQQRHDSRRDHSIADNEIWTIYADSLHNVWTGHERGFSLASNSTVMRTISLGALTGTGEGNEIRIIRRDRNGNLWMGGSNGLIRIPPDGHADWYQHTLVPGSLPHNQIRDLFEDSEGRIWLGSDGGLIRYEPATNDFRSFEVTDAEGRHNSSWVYSVAEEGGYLWVGSFLNGIHYISKDRLVSPSLQGDGPERIAADLSVNTDTPNKMGIELANNLVNRIVVDPKGDIWILLFRDNSLMRIRRNSKGSKEGTQKTEKFDIYGMTGGYPTHLALDSRGRIWCAFNSGIVMFDGDRHSMVRFPSSGSDETILAMGPVGDGMWISTQSNVWSVDGKSLESTLLPIPQKSYTAIFEDTVTGKVILGGIDELLEVDSSIVRTDSDYSSVKLVLHDDGDGRLRLYNAGTKGLNIPNGGRLTLVVSTLEFSPGTVQRYMYKLADSPDDMEGGWIILPEGVNSITFSNLKWGTYHLLVKTAGSPDAPLTILLRVEPPLYLSWWAILLYFLGASALVWLIRWLLERRRLRLQYEREREEALASTRRKLSLMRQKEKERVQTIAEAQTRPIEAEALPERRLARVTKVIEDNISDPDLNVTFLCEKTEIPSKQLYRLVKKYMDVSPIEYIRNLRLQKAAELLSQKKFTVSEVGYMVGFKTPSYFTKCFNAKYGVLPSVFRGQNIKH